MRLETVEDEGAFALMGGEWGEIVAASGHETPFVRHGWLLAWWRAFGAGARLAVVTCRDDEGTLLGLLPLYRRRVGIVLPATTLRLLGDEQVGATGLGAIVRAGLEDAVIPALLAHLRNALQGWDVLELRGTDPDSAWCRHVMQAPPGARVRETPGAYSRPRTALPVSYEEYLKLRMRRESRKRMRTARRDATAAGGRLETISDPAALPRAQQDLIRLVEGRMQYAVGPGFHFSPEYRAFLQAALPQLFDAGQLRLLFLTIGAERVAVNLQVSDGTTTYRMLGGFDERWSKDNVFKALTGYAIEMAITEGSSVLDFGLGDQDHKASIGADEVLRFSDVRVYARSAAAYESLIATASVERVTACLLRSPASIRKPLLRFAKSVLGAARRVGRRRG